MAKEHQIIKQVYTAKECSRTANDLIIDYIPFIRSEASRVISRPCTEQDDEYSIAMMAFHEAIMGYEKGRGGFLNYASLIIKSRITDYIRKELRHRGNISLSEDSDEEGASLINRLADKEDRYEESDNLEATKQEIAELASVMAGFGVGFSDIADNSPKQQRTLEACSAAVNFAVENPELLEELLESKKLPMIQLVLGSGVERKTLERHRKYILAMLLIQTNGYEIIRGHLRQVLKRKGGMSR